MAATLSFVGTFTKGVINIISFAGSLSFSGAFNKNTSHKQTASLSFSGAINRSTSYILSAGLTFSGAIKRLTGQLLTGGLSFSSTFIYGAGVIFTAALTFTGNVLKGTARNLTPATLGFVGNLGRGFFKLFKSSITFITNFYNGLIGQIVGNLWYENPDYFDGTIYYNDPNTKYNATVPYNGAPNNNIASVYNPTSALWTPQGVNKETQWSQNPEYLENTLLYNDPSTKYNALIPFNGTTTGEITPNYSPTSALWTPQVANNDTLWNQNPSYFQKAIMYNDPATSYNAPIPYDSIISAELTTSKPLGGTIWS